MITQLTSRHYPLWVIRVLRVTLFAVLIALAAKIAIPIPGTPVPITGQVLAVLLAGMTLGPVEGATSVIAYLAAIAAGFPVDAGSLGTAALVSASAGYLIGFPFGAFVAGLGWRVDERYKLPVSIMLGIAGVIVIYVFGMIGLMRLIPSLPDALMAGVVKFVLVDFGKVLLAASLVKLGHESWQRWLAPDKIL